MMIEWWSLAHQFSPPLRLEFAAMIVPTAPVVHVGR
jgi:hypothetical protein